MAMLSNGPGAIMVAVKMLANRPAVMAPQYAPVSSCPSASLVRRPSTA